MLGRLFSWSVPGQLGRRNSARNPRRTAITAAALMVGLALITGVNVILTSATTSLTKVADTQVSVDLIISGQQNSSIPPTFDPAVMTKVKQLSGVTETATFYQDVANIDGEKHGLVAVDNVAALHDLFGVNSSAGRTDTLGAGQLLVDRKQADSLGLKVGQHSAGTACPGPAAQLHADRHLRQERPVRRLDRLGCRRRGLHLRPGGTGLHQARPGYLGELGKVAGRHAARGQPGGERHRPQRVRQAAGRPAQRRSSR